MRQIRIILPASLLEGQMQWRRLPGARRKDSAMDRDDVISTLNSLIGTCTNADGARGKQPTHWMVPSGGERKGADVPQRRFTYGATMIRFALIGLAGLAYKTAQAQPLPYPTSQTKEKPRRSGALTGVS